MFKYGLALCALLALVLGGSASALVAQERQGPPPRVERSAPVESRERAVPRNEARPNPGVRDREDARPMPGNSPGLGAGRGPMMGPRDGRGPRGPRFNYRDIGPRGPRSSVREFFYWIPLAHARIASPFVSGLVEFMVTPQFARIYINDRYVGMVYDVRQGLFLAPGHYRLTIVCEDVVFTRPIEVQSNRSLVVEAHLFD